MTDRKANYVHQRQPLPVPANMNDMKRFVQALEEILDDIYRRYGRLRASDLDKNVNDTLNTALRTAAANDATAPETQGGTSGETIPKYQIDIWAAKAAELGRRQGMTGSRLSSYISSYIQQRIAEA